MYAKCIYAGTERCDFDEEDCPCDEFTEYAEYAESDDPFSYDEATDTWR